MLWALLLIGPQAGARSKVNYYRDYGLGLQSAHIALGKRLAELAGDSSEAKAFTVALGDAGAIPYYSEWRTVDIIGLSDRHIATAGGFDVQYVLNHQPDVIVLASNSTDRVQRPRYPEFAALYREATRQGYDVVAVLRFEDDYYIWVLALPNSPVAERLRGWGVTR